MIRLNFIPAQARTQRTNLVGEDFGGVPGEIILGGIVALAGFLVLVHVALAGVAVYKLARHKILEVRWGSLGADRQAYDEVTRELSGLQLKMNTLRPITSAQGLDWARLLNELSDSVPKGVWLREVVYDKSSFTIYGSSVSKVKNEMVEAGNFVAAIKEQPSIRENFAGVDVDSIQRRENTSVSIADFSLKVRRK